MPKSPVPSPSLTVPTLRRRMAAWLYEGLLLFGVVFITDYLFSALTQTRHALHNRHEQQLLLFLVLGLYFSWFWSRGHTLAMKTWHIRVLDRTGQPLTRARALWRYLLSWIWFLPPLALSGVLGLNAGQTLGLMLGWIACWALLARLQPQRQFWHDAWAGTQLVQDARPMA